MSTSLGLIESKRGSVVVHNVMEQGTAVDPALDQGSVSVQVINPSVSMSQIYETWSNGFYVFLQTRYKYVLPVSRKRVRLGAELTVKDSFLVVRSVLYEPNPAGSKQVYKRYEQKAIAFVHGDDKTKSINIVLRTRNGKQLADDLIDQMSASGVIVTQLPDEEAERLRQIEAEAKTQALAAAKAAADQANLEKKAAEMKAKQEAEAKAAEERKKQLDELEARRKSEEAASKKPLPFAPPAPYTKQPFAVEQSLVLGDQLDADDFFSDLQPDASVPPAPAAASITEVKTVAPPAPVQVQPAPAKAKSMLDASPEELAARGVAAFVQDEVHEQLWSVYEQTVAQWKPVVVVTVDPQDGQSDVPQQVIHPTVFVMYDVQYLFQNYFDVIDQMGESLSQLFPLWDLHPDASSPQIYSTLTQEYILIDNPNRFSVFADLLRKDKVGFILHKCRLSCNITNARTARNLREQIQVLSKKLEAIVTAFRQRRAASVTQAAVPAPATAPSVAVQAPDPKLAACNCSAQFRTSGQPVRPPLPKVTNLSRNLNLNQKAMAAPQSESDDTTTSGSAQKSSRKNHRRHRSHSRRSGMRIV